MLMPTTGTEGTAIESPPAAVIDAVRTPKFVSSFSAKLIAAASYPPFDDSGGGSRRPPTMPPASIVSRAVPFARTSIVRSRGPLVPNVVFVQVPTHRP